MVPSVVSSADFPGITPRRAEITGMSQWTSLSMHTVLEKAISNMTESTEVVGDATSIGDEGHNLLLHRKKVKAMKKMTLLLSLPKTNRHKFLLIIYAVRSPESCYILTESRTTQRSPA